MKNTSLIIRETFNWLFISLPFIYILVVQEKLPEFEPFSANTDQRTYQLVLFVMGITIFWYVVFLIKPTVIPKMKFSNHFKSFHKMKSLLVIFSSLLCITFISDKAGIAFNWAKIGLILSFAFVMVAGNLYPTLRNKYLIGVKNSWTQNDDQIWRKTHQFAGKVYFYGGIVGVLYGIFFNPTPVPYMPLILVSYMFILYLIPNIYSFIIYRKSIIEK